MTSIETQDAPASATELQKKKNSINEHAWNGYDFFRRHTTRETDMAVSCTFMDVAFKKK